MKGTIKVISFDWARETTDNSRAPSYVCVQSEKDNSTNIGNIINFLQYVNVIVTVLPCKPKDFIYNFDHKRGLIVDQQKSLQYAENM